MNIPKFRGWLYLVAKLLGDVQAVQQSNKKKSLKPVEKRIMRRIAGKVTGRLLGKIFR